MPKNKKDKNGGFATLAITQPDSRQKDTNMAQPDDENVKEARDWVNHNKK